MEGTGESRRRSPRPHPQIRAIEERRSPQIHASEDGARVTRRRGTSPEASASLPDDDDVLREIAIEVGAGVIRRRSPQIHAIEDGAGVTRRRGTSPEASASLPDDDDVLREILLRLPPQPSSLPRASAVCSRWWGLVTDPKFHSQFYAHHQKPPLLGVFLSSNHGIKFNPILDPPDRITPRHLDLGRYGSSSRGHFNLLDCRHGLVLIKHGKGETVVVCDPITGENRHVEVPPDFNLIFLKGAVLCAADNLGHVHGACHSIPFKMILMSTYRNDNTHIACVYSSETGRWGNLVSVEAPCVLPIKPAVLVGNCLYWLSMEDDILEFDLDDNNLTVIRGPPVTNDILGGNRQIIQAEDGAFGYVTLSYPHFQMWQRNVSGHGVVTFVPWKTVEMHTTLGLSYPNEGVEATLLGYDEDTNVLFLVVDDNVYMVQLKSMESKKLSGIPSARYYPFKSFYTPGTTIHGGPNGAEIARFIGGSSNLMC